MLRNKTFTKPAFQYWKHISINPNPFDRKCYSGRLKRLKERRIDLLCKTQSYNDLKWNRIRYNTLTMCVK